MRWKSVTVIAALMVVLGAGCTSATKAGLPLPASPPVSGHTEAGLLGAIPGTTNKLIYGCTTQNSTIWASISAGADQPGTTVTEADVNVYDGYHQLLNLQPGNPFAWAIFSPGTGSTFDTTDNGNVGPVHAGQCFTIVITVSGTEEVQASNVNFVVNW
jgi:hypothetical protein